MGDKPANGTVERVVRTLKEAFMAMLCTANMPGQYWSLAVLHAAWVYNSVPHSSRNKIPFNYFWKKKNRRVDYTNLQFFGVSTATSEKGKPISTHADDA